MCKLENEIENEAKNVENDICLSKSDIVQCFSIILKLNFPACTTLDMNFQIIKNIQFNK